MHIVVAHSHLSGLGGGERCTLEALRYLSRRHEVTLWAGGYMLQATFPDLADYARHDVPWPMWLTNVPRADVVVTQSFGASLLALRHPRTLCYVHTLRSVYLGGVPSAMRWKAKRSMGGARPDLALRRALDRAAMARADRLLTNSQYTAERIQRGYGREAVLVPPGVDADLLAEPEQVGSYALYVGRLAPEKGIERLLRWTRGLPIDVILAGQGEPDYVAHLRALAGPRVHFHGPLLGAELRATYAGARFLAFLPHEEEFGLAALEAMAAAKPVLAAPEGGPTELIESGVNGFLVRDEDELAAAVTTLLADDALCLRLGRAGRARAQGYTWDRFGAAIEDLCVRSLEAQRG